MRRSGINKAVARDKMGQNLIFKNIELQKELGYLWKFGNISKSVERIRLWQWELEGLTEKECEVELRGHEQVKIKNKLKY